MQVMPATSAEPRRASSLPVPLSAAFSCTGLQVGRVQSPLPCFPSTVLFPGVSLFSSGSHRSGSPPSQILRRRCAILDCTLVAYDFAFRLPPLPSLISCSRSRAPVGPEVVLSGQGHFAAGVPHSGFSTRTTQNFSGSLLIHSIPLPCSRIPAGSKRPRQNGLSDTAPAPNKAKAPTCT